MAVITKAVDSGDEGDDGNSLRALNESRGFPV